MQFLCPKTSFTMYKKTASKTNDRLQTICERSMLFQTFGSFLLEQLEHLFDAQQHSSLRREEHLLTVNIL